MSDHGRRALHQRGQGPDVYRLRVDQSQAGAGAVVFGPSDLQQGQRRPVAAFAVELGVEGVAIDVLELFDQLVERLLVCDEGGDGYPP
jgi:hypothetical protein